MAYAHCEVWLIMDSWGVELACKMIVLGYNADVESTISFGFEHCPEGTRGRDRANELIIIMNRISVLAKSAIAIGVIKDPDTPQNWITWAKGKGYNTDHLDPSKQVLIFQKAIEDYRITYPDDDFPGCRESYQEQLTTWKKVELIFSDNSNEANLQRTNKEKSRRTLQVELLLCVIDRHQTSRFNIPVGKKQDFMNECLKSNKIFSSVSVFNKVWSELSMKGIISIEGKENFLQIQ